MKWRSLKYGQHEKANQPSVASVGLELNFWTLNQVVEIFLFFTIDFVLTKKSLSVNFIFPQIFSKTKIP